MKWALLLVIVSFLISCREDEAPLRTIFTATVDNSYKLYETRTDSTYIILQNSDGEMLHMKRVETGDVVKFESEFPGDKIDVTIARVYPDGSGGGLANVWTYLDVPAGQSWTLRYDQVVYGTARQSVEVGSYTMVLNNAEPIYAMSISDHYFSVTSRRTSTPPGLKAGIRKDVPRHLLSLHTGAGNPKYLFIEPKIDETYTIDYNTMLDFDKVVSVPLSEQSYVYAHVMGYETMEDFKYLTGFVLYDNVTSVSARKSSVNLGYLNGMAKFRTELSVSNGKVNVIYISRGAMPDNIKLPNYDDIVLQEKTPATISYSSKIDVAYRISWFVSNNFNPGTNGMAWYIYAPGGRTRQPSMPQFMLEKFPKIGANSMRHSSTTFYTKSWTYDEFLQREFGPTRKAEEDEFEDIAVILN
jgi:hypothetical protein